MNTYHKIQTVFLRDPEKNFKGLLEGQFAKPEFEYLANARWVLDEKLDGTNIRILWNGFNMEVRGKTDNAQLHTDLVRNIQALITPEKLAEQFGVLGTLEGMSQTGPGEFTIEEKPLEVCLYGEGVGPGIQKGGGGYGKDKKFVLFDVLIGNFWLQRADVEKIATALGCEVAPVIATCTLHEAVELVRQGFKSQWGDFMAEGIIARPEVQLTNRFGERVITKLKHKDFHEGAGD